MSMSTSMSLRMDMRPMLVQKLEQRIEQSIDMAITLTQYLAREEIVQGLIRYADENKTWVDVDKDGFQYTFANVPYGLAKPLARRLGPGFAHCLYDPFEGRVKGEWTLFVVGDMYPEMPANVPFISIHERGEEISLGDHYFASQLEFAQVAKEAEEVGYGKFINTHHPSKFVDLTQKINFPILPKELVSTFKK